MTISAVPSCERYRLVRNLTSLKNIWTSEDQIRDTEVVTFRINLLFKSPYLSRRDAAAYLCVAYQTLANKAVDGSGPPFKRPTGKATGGLARYRIDDLDLYMETSGDYCARTAAQPRWRAAKARSAER